MDAKFVKSGKTFDITPATAIAAGDIVINGGLVGVAHLDIPAGVLGSLSTEGIYEVAKAADVAFALGAPVKWNAASGTATAAEGDTEIGKAVAAAAAADTVVLVKIG